MSFYPDPDINFIIPQHWELSVQHLDTDVSASTRNWYPWTATRALMSLEITTKTLMRRTPRYFYPDVDVRSWHWCHIKKLMSVDHNLDMSIDHNSDVDVRRTHRSIDVSSIRALKSAPSQWCRTVTSVGHQPDTASVDYHSDIFWSLFCCRLA